MLTGPPRVSTYTILKSLKVKIVENRMTTARTGLRSGNVTCQNRPHGPAPSTSAASWNSRGIETRSEEHTSELQSRLHLVCRLLLEKKKTKKKDTTKTPQAENARRCDSTRLASSQTTYSHSYKRRQTTSCQKHASGGCL